MNCNFVHSLMFHKTFYLNVRHMACGSNMIREYESRIALRLPKAERAKIEQLINEGKFKNISQVVRAALQELLEKN